MRGVPEDVVEVIGEGEKGGCGKNLDQRVTAGTGHVLKLHHTAGKKIRYRGKGSYDIYHLPMKGGDEGGGAQRLSGLEMSILYSRGACGIQKEGMLLRGEYRPEFLRAISKNRPPPTLTKPFVWDKFLALLRGSGVNPKDFGSGKLPPNGSRHRRKRDG